MQDSVLAQVFLESTLTVFEKHKQWADQAIKQLTDEQLRQPLDDQSNSVAVIMKHVAGNLLSRWTEFLTTDGEKPWRDRDQEFVDNFPSREEILAYWNEGWNCLFDSLKSLAPPDFQKTITIRGEPHSVPLALQRSLAHCAYHIGQILMLSRHWSGEKWKTITIPRGQSSKFNNTVWGSSNYGSKETPPGTPQEDD
ncbi:MAG: DUF1572 family protein [Planctomycetaceae bacterium]|nr:DUF1572 family protein [Planctomycetaceae bacterium]